MFYDIQMYLETSSHLYVISVLNFKEISQLQVEILHHNIYSLHVLIMLLEDMECIQCSFTDTYGVKLQQSRWVSKFMDDLKVKD